MKNKCKFAGIMFLCILIVCTLAVMAYEHTAGMKGAAGGASNASGFTNFTDEADYFLTVVTYFYPMFIAALNFVVVRSPQSSRLTYELGIVYIPSEADCYPC